MIDPSPRALTRFRALAVATAVALYAQVVLGGVVRVTDSGEACKGWPLCGGKLVPAFDYHVVIEYSHRSVGFVAICLVTATMLASWWVHKEHRQLRLWAEVTFLLVIVQAVLGGITVLLGLPASAILLHLGNAMLVLGAALLVALWAGRVGSDRWRSTPRMAGIQRMTVYAAAIGTLMVILTGAYVVGQGASSACPGWPLCGNPAPNGLADVHMLHRAFVLLQSITVAAATYMAWRHWRRTPMALVPNLTMMALLLTVAAGAAQVLLALPAALRALHLTLATGVWSGVVLMAGAAWLEARSGESAPSVRARRLAKVGAG